MKKIVIVGTSVLLGCLLMSGCSSKTPDVANHSVVDAKKAAYTHFESSLSMKSLHKIIKKAGENAGWRMTEFKENALIAEKEGEEASTVHFDRESFHLTPENSSLQESIEDAIKERLENRE